MPNNKKLKVTEVFTPNKSSPKLSQVARRELEEKVQDSLDEQGMYIFIQGVTKLGKTTLAKTAVSSQDQHFWFDCQNLRGGTEDLWAGLASLLRQPVEEAINSTNTDTSKWWFVGTLGVLTGRAGGQHAVAKGNTKTISNDLPLAVRSALEALVESGKTVSIVLDDFHFIEEAEVRTQILQALKPVADKGVSIVVVTLPERNNTQSFTSANIGGRSTVFEVPLWSPTELSEIAETGFKELNVWADEQALSLLARNSFGSPQIMQNLCLQLCRGVHNIRERQEGLTKVTTPAEPESLFKRVSDHTALGWLGHLGAGLVPRGKPRTTYPITEGQVERGMDAYTLVLHALRDLGPKPKTPLADLKAKIGEPRGVDLSRVNKMNLTLTLNSMTQLALRETTAKLKEIDDESKDLDPDDIFVDGESKSVPQPVFEWSRHEPSSPINILDPLLLYMLKWHWMDVLSQLEGVRSREQNDN